MLAGFCCVLLTLISVSAAIADMQKDPKAAMRKYANDKEVTTFIVAFMKLMGNHMEDLGAAEAAEEEEKHKKAAAVEARRKAEQAKPRQADPAQVQRWMSDPTIRVSSAFESTQHKVWQSVVECLLTLSFVRGRLSVRCGVLCAGCVERSQHIGAAVCHPGRPLTVQQVSQPKQAHTRRQPPVDKAARCLLTCVLSAAAARLLF